jgi:hypothetical protein
LFGYPLDQHLNLKHPLMQLAALIDWAEIDKTFSGQLSPIAAAQLCRLVWWRACCISTHL